MPGIKAKRKQLVRKTLMRAKAQSERAAEQRQELPEEYAQTEVQQGISDVAARTGNTARSTARMSYRKFRAMQEKRKNLTLQGSTQSASKLTEKEKVTVPTQTERREMFKKQRFRQKAIAAKIPAPQAPVPSSATPAPPPYQAQILTVPVDDDITFTFKSIGEIREGDEYTGYRVALTADFPPMAVPLKLDITTGDKITPREIQYDYKLMLEDRHIQVMAYNLATILAEKLETVISRSDQNTRPRDYYDVYILTKLQAENIDFPALGAALMATASKRGSDSILQDYRAIVEAVRNSEIMRRQWDNYRKDFDYASTISFDEVCDAVASTMDTLITNNFLIKLCSRQTFCRLFSFI